MMERQNPGSSKVLSFCIFLMILSGFQIHLSQVKAEDGVYQVIKHNLPKTIQPGQQVMGQIILKVIKSGNPAYTRPFASLQSFVDSKRILDLSGHQMIPWHYSADQKEGDTFCAGFSMDVPMDFPAGAARIVLILTRNGKSKSWEYAQFKDSEGKSLGDKFYWDTEVVNSFAGEADSVAEIPLVIGRMESFKLDGHIDPEEWKRAGHIDKFRENTGNILKAQAQAWVGYDDKNLYIAVNCQEPLMSQAKQKVLQGRDPGVWGNECVEVFLNPQADQVSFIHFGLDILNQRYDALGSDYYGYNPKWESAVSKGTSEWSSEIMIPFSSLGVDAPKSGQLWYSNLCRERQAEPELSAWKATFGSFGTPSKFGIWVFDSLKGYLKQKASSLNRKELDGVKEMEGRVQKWDQAFMSWQDRFGKMDETAILKNYSKLATELDRMTADFKRLQLEKMRLSGGSAIVVTQGWPYERFSGDLSSIDKQAGPVKVTLLHDEWVELAWNIKNFNDKPATLRCAIFRGKYDQDSGADYLNIGLPGCETLWQQVFPVAAGGGRPVYDAVVPAPGGIIQISAGATSQVWLSIQGSKNIQSPVTVNVVFEPVDGTEVKPIVLPLTINPLPISLTANPKIHCFTWDFYANPIKENQDWYRAHLKDLKAHGIDVIMISSLGVLPRVKANPDGTLAEKMDFSKLDYLISMTKDLFSQYYLNLDIWEKNTMRTDLFGLPPGTPEYEKAFKIWFRQVLGHLFARGLTYDRFMVNPYDECSDARAQLLARWVKEVDPKVRIVIDNGNTDSQETRKMDALTDVWIPHYKTFFSEDFKPFHDYVRATGKPFWCYFYSEGSNEKEQDPTSYYLGKFWWAFANNVGGVCYWTMGYYGDPWYRVNWKASYETALVYPTEGGVIPSRRWQAWRQGWQDHCLLSLAKEKFSAKKDHASLEKLQTYVTDVVAVPGDPYRREKVRDWVKTKLGEQ